MSLPFKLALAAGLLLTASGALAATWLRPEPPTHTPVAAPHARLDDTGNFAPTSR